MRSSISGLGRDAFVAMLLVGSTSCLPGDPGKELTIVNNCQVEVWVRASEDSKADASGFSAPVRIPSGEELEFSAFDNDTDGIAVAVSRSESDVGKITAVPHSSTDHLRVILQGDRCI